MLLRIGAAYIRRCIRCGTISAAIPEAAFAAEVIPNVSRVQFLDTIGTPAAAAPIEIPGISRITGALSLGFKVLHGGRISYGQIANVTQEQWAPNIRHSAHDRQKRLSAFVHHFNDFSFRALQDFGEKLANVHGIPPQSNPFAQIDTHLWRKGLSAEQRQPRFFSDVKAFERELKRYMADWADFDIAATHYAYGYDYLCTADTGTSHQDSIFGPKYATQLDQFGVKNITLPKLARLCWSRYWVPLRSQNS